MPRNNAFTAPTGTPELAFTFDETTKFINIQNTDSVNPIVFGFSEAEASATEGVVILAGDTYPIPLDGNSGTIYTLGTVGTVSCRLIRG